MRHSGLLRVTSLLASAALWVLSACASDPASSVRDILDPHTGTTLTRLAQPVEFLSENLRGASADPFAYVGPFQTNRMGRFALYLWVAVAAPEGATSGTPVITCDSRLLTLEPVEGAPGGLGLSESPYTAPAPWSRISYFVLTNQDLDCLRQASQSTLTLSTDAAEPQRFVADRRALAVLATFAAQSSTEPR